MKQEEKNDLRRLLKKRRNEITQSQRLYEEKLVYEKISNTEAFQRAKAVLCFLSYGTEFETKPLMELAFYEKKEVYVPKVTGEHTMRFYQIHDFQALKPGAYGILEPEETAMPFWYNCKTETVMFVPGLGFDRSNYRIGYGKGYYDTFLTELYHEGNFRKENFVTIGLGFQCQIVEKLPVEKHDFPLDYVFTSGYDL